MLLFFLKSMILKALLFRVASKRFWAFSENAKKKVCTKHRFFFAKQHLKSKKNAHVNRARNEGGRFAHLRLKF